MEFCMKRLSLIPVFIVVICFLFPRTAAAGVLDGLELWYKRLVPSLFPFAVAGNMLVATGALDGLRGLNAVARWIGIPAAGTKALAVGAVSGYPVGAQISAELVESGQIKRNDLGRVAALASLCSPMFMVATVGVGMMDNTKVGVIVLLCHYLAHIVAYKLVFRTRNEYKVESDVLNIVQGRSLGALLRDSIDKAARTLVGVCGYIVLFSLVGRLLSRVPYLGADAVAVISTVLEMSSGCAGIAKSTLPIAVRVGLLCFAVSWGGACVNMQIAGFVGEGGGSVTSVVLFKLTKGLIALAVGYIVSALVL